jgi:hypothetical protein
MAAKLGIINFEVGEKQGFSLVYRKNSTRNHEFVE